MADRLIRCQRSKLEKARRFRAIRTRHREGIEGEWLIAAVLIALLGRALIREVPASLIAGVGQGIDQKLHCSLVDQRKGRFEWRLTARREILWWKICAGIARKSGSLAIFKLFIINSLTRWRWMKSPANRSLGQIPC